MFLLLGRNVFCIRCKSFLYQVEMLYCVEKFMYHVGKLMFCDAEHKFPDVEHKTYLTINTFTLRERFF